MASRAVTTLIAAAALLLVLWFGYSAVTGATLIVFRTGSMAPTLPQGALALSLPITAEEIQVDDVITVQREGESLPVTHRVIEINDPVSSATDETAHLTQAHRLFVLQGDDNATPDFQPYVIDHARKVVFGVPGAGTALMLMQSPLGMGILVLFAGVIAVWAFWPKPEPEQKASGVHISKTPTTRTDPTPNSNNTFGETASPSLISPHPRHTRHSHSHI